MASPVTATKLAVAQTRARAVKEAPIPTAAKAAGVAAKRRAQQIRYELLANDGRYSSKKTTAVKRQSDLAPRPLMWAVIPAGPKTEARFFGAASDPEAARLSSAMFRELQLPGWSAPRSVVLLPVHWEEAQTLKQRFPSLEIIEDGKVYRGASPRSLFVGPGADELPKLVAGLEKYSLKMHLSRETYDRLGGLGGNRDINMNDALLAAVIDHVLAAVKPELSPYLDFQSEARSMAVKIEAPGSAPQEVGLIFRTLSQEDVIPAFSLYSPTKESLPHLKKSAVVREKSKPAVLASEAIAFAMKRNPELSKVDAFDRLFAEPVYDVLFSLFRQGFTMELHPQNFLMRFDEKTGLTKGIVVRDLHGMNYNADWRKKNGKSDVFDPQALQGAFPGLAQSDLDGWFTRNGELRDRYKAPQMFETTLDFHSAIFFYHLLDSLHEDGTFDRATVEAAIERVKDRMEEKAKAYGFDLGVLSRPKRTRMSFWIAEEDGIRGQVLFRRREPKPVPA